MPTPRSGASAWAGCVSAMNGRVPRGCSDTISSIMSPSTGVITGFSVPSVRLSSQALYSGGAGSRPASIFACVHATMAPVLSSRRHWLQLTSTRCVESHSG
jgi:hypothetical protein